MQVYIAEFLGLLLLFSTSIAQALPDPTLMEISEEQNQMLPDANGDAKLSSPEQAAKNFAAISDYMARLEWQNGWDAVLNKQCPSGQGFYRVRSKHNNGREDRRWEFYCRQVVQTGNPTCTKTSSYINNFRDAISFMCSKNQYLGAVESYHDNSKEDRRWKFTCCSAPSYATKDCRLTDYVNHLDRKMDFQASEGEVITGVVSYYSTGTRLVDILCIHAFAGVSFSSEDGAVASKINSEIKGAKNL